MTLDRIHSKDVQINEDLDFSSLVSNPVLLKALENAGYRRPSPIQLKTIPLGRLGLDLIAQAKSGTGKTIVFSVVAIESVLASFPPDSKIASPTDDNGSATTAASQKHSQPQQPKAVIIAPTREIAVQIQSVIQSLTQPGFQNQITSFSMIGGMPIQHDKERLKRCSIVVGTPGRVRYLMSSGELKTNQVRLLVLDEADKLMEDGFREDVFTITKNMGSNKQVMAFSATYDDDLLAHLDQLVKNPLYVMLSNGSPELEGVTQFFKVATLDETHKDSSVFLKQIRLMESKFSELESLFTYVPFYQAMVFLNLRSRAVDLVKFLNRKGWPAMHIASGISQKERLEIMQKARTFEIRVLVCSDLIARGIDIDRVNLVVNLDLPKDPETYLHRIGRTGRYGTAGLAVSIVDDAELATIKILKQDFGITIHELSAEDKVYKDLKQRTKNQHHERPLQVSKDVEQFKKLEAKRVEGEKRSLEDTEAVISIPTDVGASKDHSQERVSQERVKKNKAPGPTNAKGTMAKKRRLLTKDMNTLMMTPETTPPATNTEVERTPTQQPGQITEEDVDTGVVHRDDSPDEEYDGPQGDHHQDPANVSYQPVDPRYFNADVGTTIRT
ncbi:DEAD (Asp-Glu-Ala-Asp) box polypeptide 20 [Mortierella sp. GBA43]|nr:DEAD (Asp-Glu-Ala-Asp) box polypeptide 20 [Mortierella sp. GBA43]